MGNNDLDKYDKELVVLLEKATLEEKKFVLKMLRRLVGVIDWVKSLIKAA